MKKLILIAISIIIYSCNESQQEDSYNLYVGVEFSIINSENEDLLNPESTNKIDVDKIRIYHLINGKKTYYFKGNLDSPKGFKVYKHENEYRIGIALNHTETSAKPITYIEWNENDTDTIEATFKSSNSSLIQQKIWLNGKEVWELGNNTIDPFFVLSK
jgi:hypothetical protein